MTRTEMTIRQHFTLPKLQEDVQKTCERCHTCQLTKKTKKKYGKLPPKEPEADPWEILCVDLIGPYTIEHKGKKTLTLHCLTMIDPATGWFEIVSIPDKQADTIANLIEVTWLTRYPWPGRVQCDRGNEFMAEVKDMLKEDYGIKIKRISVRNPQANAIIERIHQTIGNIIRTFQVHSEEINEEDPWTGILATTMFATRATVHTTLGATPSQLVFGRDAILNAAFEADWGLIKQRKKELIAKNNERENSKRIDYQYTVGEKVLLKEGLNTKYGGNPYSGPYKITRVNDNGTLRIKKGAKYDTINIRNAHPYKE